MKTHMHAAATKAWCGGDGAAGLVACGICLYKRMASAARLTHQRWAEQELTSGMVTESAAAR